MENIKELFNKARTKVNESKAISTMKNFILDNKLVNYTKSKITRFTDFFKGTVKPNITIKDSMTGDVSGRFSSKFKKFFKNFIKSMQIKADNGNKFIKVITAIIKVLSIIATIAFIGIVIYCIKDVFIQCLMLVATCAAIAICIEFIFSILSIATGCKV